MTELKTGYSIFDDFIARLREQGIDEEAMLLHTMLHECAWTMASELIGELGLALLRIEKTHGHVFGSETRKQFKRCMAFVREVWPHIKL